MIPSEEVQRQVARALVYGKKHRGRALKNNVDELGLKKHDRLEPSKKMWDVASFERLHCPFTVTFFRSRKENRLIHSCPLFMIPGVTIRSWVVDIMHSWHLGDLLSFIAHVFWYIIGLGILCPPSHQLDTEERHRLSLLRLKSEWFEHYRTKRKDPDFRQSCSEDLCFLHKVE